ncbi:copper homeostasis protein CutC [Tahibacter harae]|uniref:Copper homeostasis protein cutC homolog n=1 Tax=Tahibacter harae TaxID=2963937 RepID=A0ABT1QWP5_9GAMM|nr:copper homeostasis protein CutC [Tahibacter harae]MCQ4166710.1 copper homeostasis protein CutC [Tahibacter harae]
MTVRALPVEICLDCGPHLAADCAAAAAGGAHSIELCRDMAAQGLTPGAADLAAARAQFPRAGLYPMIRPRRGDFDYSGAEIALMLEQIAQAAGQGADGVVFGALRGGALDTAALARLFAAARMRGLRSTFHRAFDALDDAAAGLETLIGLGADRIMSSGTRWGSSGGAVAGAQRLAALIAQADGRVEVVLGGGIAAATLAALLEQLPHTGAVSLHAYGSVLSAGRVDAGKVAELVRMAQIAG